MPFQIFECDRIGLALEANNALGLLTCLKKKSGGHLYKVIVLYFRQVIK